MNNSSDDNAKLFEQQKEVLKSFTKEELNFILNNYNFILRKIDNLWDIRYFSNAETNCPYIVVGKDLAYILKKMIKVKKETDQIEHTRNIMSITNGC